MEPMNFLPTLKSLLEEKDQPFIHRDLSWMQFNERVLEESKLDSNPLFERLKFLAISSSNLDEFFSIRVASLKKQERVKKQLFESVTKFIARQSESFEQILAELQNLHLPIVREPSFGARSAFYLHVFPEIGPPEVFGPKALSKLENLQMLAIFPSGICFRIPKSVPSTIVTASEFFLLDDLLLNFLGSAFKINEKSGLIRLTRDGDLGLGSTGNEELYDPETIPDVVRKKLNGRDLGRPIRIQYRGTLREDDLNEACKTFKIKPEQVFQTPSSLCLGGLWSIVKAKSGLNLPHFEAYMPDVSFEAIQKRDLLLHHPYDSFDAFVEFIRQACTDDSVQRIELCVYRTDAVSPLVTCLKEAAKSKQVVVVIELRARFDESNNLKLAEDLKYSGVKVKFGLSKLKLHAKIALVTRNHNEKLQFFTHLSTGNYNSTTAKQYTDLAILTSKESIGEDARNFFDSIYKNIVPQNFSILIPAPHKLHDRVLHLIKQETTAAKSGKPARIFAKVNALIDKELIKNLYLASQAGVRIDLVVRGACSLIPGVVGLSENIRVVSIVDRYLEHSRIYFFENSGVMYLSSADWMPRNFFSRVELAFPVTDPNIYEHIRSVIIPAYINDCVKGRELTPQGTWKKRVFTKGSCRAQFYFQELRKQNTATLSKFEAKLQENYVE